MKKVSVGVAGYATIGQRLADSVALQGDMELVRCGYCANSAMRPSLAAVKRSSIRVA